MRTILTFACAAVVSLGTSAIAGSHASGDAGAGEKVFKQCQTCHMVKSEDGSVEVGRGKVGPNLYALAGRTAASVDGFKYGKSILALGETGFVWDEASFVEYVADPKKFLATQLDDKKAMSKMAFKLRKEQAAKDVWAYLVSLSE